MIEEKDIVNIRIIGISHPKNWYAQYVGTDKIFKAICDVSSDGTPIYRTFVEFLMDRVDGVYFTYENCLQAGSIPAENAEIVN